MTWVAVAVAGGAVVGGLITSSGAQSAANTQASAANYAAQIGQQEFNTITGQEAPFMQGGYGALAALEGGLGISPLTQNEISLNAPTIPATGGVGAGYGQGAYAPGPYGSGGFSSLPGLHQPAPSMHNDMVRAPTSGYQPRPGYDPSSGYQIGPGGGISQLIPSPGAAAPPNGGQTVGTPAAGTGGLGYGSLIAPFTADTWKQFSPYYNFELQQGQQGTLNGSAANSGALSGAAQKDLMSFNQNLAGTSFNNAFNMYQTQQGNIYQRLAGLTQLGQAAAANTGQQGTALTGQIGQAVTNAGTAAAAGQVGVANAWSGAVNNMSYLPWLYGNSGGAAAAAGTDPLGP